MKNISVMNRLYKVLVLSSLFSLGTYAVGQEYEDVTHYIVNAGFDDDLTFSADGATKEIVDKTISMSSRSWAYISEDNSVYAWAKTLEEGNGNWKGSDGRTHAVNGYVGQIKGWTLVHSSFPGCEWKYFGTLPYDLEERAVPIADDGTTYQAVPARPDCADGSDNKGALFLRAGWGGECSYKQVVNLPCAKYRLEYWSININENSTSDATDLTNVTCRDEVFRDESGNGFSVRTWTKHEFEFVPTSEFTLEFGYRAGNVGSGNSPYVFIDGIRLYKISEGNYDEILRSDIQNVVNDLFALSEDERLVKFKGLYDEIHDLGDMALGAATVEEMEEALAAVKAMENRVNELLPVAERLLSLMREAEKIIDASEPYSGYEDFIVEYDGITERLAEATSSDMEQIAEQLLKAVESYYASGEVAGEIIDCTFLVKNPHFIVPGAEPTYDESGVPSYPNVQNYYAGVVPVDATSEGWYKGNITSGDQRLNFAQGRVCWNLWDTSAGEHTISQNLTNLPDGYYSVSADMITQPDWPYEAHVYAKTNDSDVSSPFLVVGYWNDSNNGRWTTLTTEKIRVTDGTLTIGGRSVFPEYTQKGWFCMTNVHLYFHGKETVVDEIKFVDENLSVVAGESFRLTVSILPEDATFKNLKWESSDPDVVSVDDDGNLFAWRKGSATITASSCRNEQVCAVCLVEVSDNTAGVSSLQINEIQSTNIDMFVDPSFNYGGWVELYNPTDKAVSLYGLYVSDDINDLKKHKLDVEAGVVPAKGFKNIWFDHNNVKRSQVNFKLDYDGGSVYLSDSEGEIIASMDYPAAVPRTSYARTELGKSTWGLTARPTPERDNGGSVFATDRIDAPEVDKDGQLFDAPFSVCVNIPSGATLRYTTDGTTPTLDNGKTSKTGIFNVSSTVTYRFRLFKDGMLPSAVVTRSYLYRDKDIVLPVISVVTDPANLYDDSLGIYVRGVNGRTGNGQTTPCNWNMDWDRPVNFEYFTPEGGMVINQEVDMAMCGGWSRAWTPHSFKLKAEKIYEGKNFYDYPVFEAKPYLKHKTLQVRNGGNDTGSRIKDPALQEIVRTSGIDVDGQAYQPAVHFINGQYIGLLNIREPNNKHFAYANYGYDSDEIDMFEMSPDSGYCQMTGTEDSFLEWYELTFNASDPETYEHICSMVDIDEYINYMAVELFLGTDDWIRNNVKAFRPRREGGKFRFVLFDLDSAFGSNSPFSLLESRKIFTFNQIYDTGQVITEEIKLVTIFLNMLDNEKFRKKFIDTFCLVAGSTFEPERCKEIINRLAERTYSTLQQEHQNPYNTANSLISSLANRKAQMMNSMKNYWKFNLSGIKEQKVKLSANIDEARLMVNNMVVPTNRFDGSLFGQVTVQADAPASYKFIGWKSDIKALEDETMIFANGDEWDYYDQGSLDGDKWTASFYGTEAWNSGNAPLGYYTGDNNNSRGYNTILDYGADASNKRPTYYFRKVFNLTKSPGENDVFVFDYTVDDGFVVYVNGQEAGRYIMPNGTINYTTFASSYATGNPDVGSITLNPSLFKKGRNAIAVEVHNNSSTSSDIYFDASLTHRSYKNNATYICRTEKYELQSTDDIELVACYEKMTDEEMKSNNFAPIRVNEICASNSTYINEYYQKNDWIELLNATDAHVDVAGMYVSDNLDKPQKYQIPSSEDINTVIAPYGYLILWADKLNPVSQIHTSFKLGAEGGEVLLTAEDGEWCDTLVYPAHESDCSVGLYPDGGNNVYLMEKQTLAAANMINSYATYFEEPVYDGIIENKVLKGGDLELAYHDGKVSIEGDAGRTVEARVFTVSGQISMDRTLVLTDGTGSISLSSLPKGTYIVAAEDDEGNRNTIKVVVRL